MFRRGDMAWAILSGLRAFVVLGLGARSLSTSLPMATDARLLEQHVFDFWFHNLKDDEPIDKDLMGKWFGGAPETVFKAKVDLVANDSSFRDSLTSTLAGRVAAIILLDQFPRNMFRGTPRAFATDPIALKLAQEIVASKDDMMLHPVVRGFCYLPYEHAEDRNLQQSGVNLHEKLASEKHPLFEEVTLGFYEYAKKHQVIIDRFGRFPHRNTILGRQPTEEENTFLENGGDTFAPPSSKK